MKKSSGFIALTLLCLLITSCANTYEINNSDRDNAQLSTKNVMTDDSSNRHLSENSLYDPQKHFTLAPIKYYDYRKYDDEGQLMPVPLSGIAGRFAWEDGCLVFISSYGGARATPILPYSITQWDSANKTLTIEDTTIKMGDLIEAGGVFIKTPQNREGVCWDYPYIVSIQVMGGIQILESEKNLSFGPP